MAIVSSSFFLSYPFITATDFQLPKGTIEPDTPFEIKGKFDNFSKQSLNVKLGIKIVDQEGEAQYFSMYTFSELRPSYYYTNFQARVPSTVPEGVYEIYPAFMIENGDWYQIPVETKADQNYRMTVNENGISFKKQ